MKNLIISIIISFSLVFSSCTTTKQNMEHSPYGEQIIHETGEKYYGENIMKFSGAYLLMLGGAGVIAWILSNMSDSSEKPSN